VIADCGLVGHSYADDLHQRSSHQRTSRNAVSRSLYRTHRTVDGQKEAQAEPEQDTDHLDQNTAAASAIELTLPWAVVDDSV